MAAPKKKKGSPFGLPKPGAVTQAGGGMPKAQSGGGAKATPNAGGTSSKPPIKGGKFSGKTPPPPGKTPVKPGYPPKGQTPRRGNSRGK